MLTKEKFIEFMNTVIKQYDATEEVWDEFQRLFGNFNGLASECMGVSLPVEMLTYIMEDTNGWINYFVYECDCGRSGKNMIWEGEDKPVPFYTVEDLWNVLTSNVDIYSIT